MRNHLATLITEPLSLGSGTRLWMCGLFSLVNTFGWWPPKAKCGACGVPGTHPLVCEVSGHPPSAPIFSKQLGRIRSPGKEKGIGLQRGNTLLSPLRLFHSSENSFCAKTKREGFHLPRILLITYERVSSSTDFETSLKWVSKTPRPINLNCFNTWRRIKGSF